LTQLAAYAKLTNMNQVNQITKNSPQLRAMYFGVWTDFDLAYLVM